MGSTTSPCSGVATVLSSCTRSMGRTKTSRRRGAAAAAGGDGGATGSDDRSQAAEVDVELLSSDPEVQEVQLRALDEQRGRPAKVRHSGNVAIRQHLRHGGTKN
jgi:hypothetical protein